MNPRGMRMRRATRDQVVGWEAGWEGSVIRRCKIRQKKVRHMIAVLAAQPLKGLPVNSCCPSGALGFVPFHPPLTRWAKEFRPLCGLEHLGHGLLVLSHTLKGALDSERLAVSLNSLRKKSICRGTMTTRAKAHDDFRGLTRP